MSGPVPNQDAVRRLLAPATDPNVPTDSTSGVERSLDAAWAEVAANTPARMGVQTTAHGNYEAWAQDAAEKGYRSLGYGYGATPVEALLALAAHLRR